MRILVLGDFIQDIYVFGEAQRLCPEAPVPVIVPHEERMTPGGAGLVAAQLEELGADVTTWYGSRSTKRRIFAGSHLICRVDEDRQEWERETSSLFTQMYWPDLVVICDYSKGALDAATARSILHWGKPCFVDAKNHWAWYEGPNVTIFPNHHEARPVVTEHEWKDGDYKRECEYQRVVSKMGKNGCRLNDAQFKDLVIPATTSEIVDVTGAGDIFMAGFVYAWSLRLPADRCARFANYLAGESCRHLGTHVVGRAFAQSVLDTLQACPELPPQTAALVHGSTTVKQTPLPQPDPLLSESDVAGFDIPFGGCDPEPTVQAAVAHSLRSGQIRRQSPSGPIASSGAPLPEDRRIDCEPGSSPPWEG